MARELIPRRLKEVRHRHGLTQQAAAARIGITPRQWMRWEARQSQPYPRNLQAIATEFREPIESFFEPDPRRVDHRTDLEVQLQVIESKLDMILTALGVEFRGRTVDELMELAGATPEQIARSRQGRTSDS